MGNIQNNESKISLFKNSKNYGKINLVLNKIDYYAGQTIEGKVKLFLKQDFPNNKIKILIIGYEENLFHFSNNRILNKEKINDPYVVTCKGFNKIYNELFIIHEDKENKCIKKGQYEIWFKFQLSKNIYNSFYKEFDSFNKKSFAKVYYSVLGGLSTDDNKIKWLTNEIKINISEKPNLNIKPIALKANQYYSHCFCFKKGKSITTFHIDKNWIYINDDISIKIFCDNSLNNNKIKNLNIKLEQKLKLYNKYFKYTYYFDIFKDSLGSINPFEIRDHKNPILFKLNSNNININEPSIESNIIYLRYYIVIEFECEGKFYCLSTPDMKILLSVFKKIKFSKKKKSKLKINSGLTVNNMEESNINSQLNWQPIRLNVKISEKMKEEFITPKEKEYKDYIEDIKENKIESKNSMKQKNKAPSLINDIKESTKYEDKVKISKKKIITISKESITKK